MGRESKKTRKGLSCEKDGRLIKTYYRKTAQTIVEIGHLSFDWGIKHFSR